MSKIFKLIVKGICVMLPMIIICIYIWRNPLGFMDHDAIFYIWSREKTNTLQDKQYETIILGDSTANAAYVPEILSDTTINLALSGSTPVENYYVLKEWLDNNQVPSACYISFYDMHFQREDCFWEWIMYSHRFSAKQNLEIIKSTVDYGEPSIITKNYITDFISYELCLPNKYITSLMNASFNQRYEDNVAAMKSNDLHGGRYTTRGTLEYNSVDTIEYSEFYVNPLFDDYYRKLISLCIENDIQVHIIKLPLPDNIVFTDRYTADFNKYYENLKESFPELTIDWIPLYDKSNFMDENHLNSHGALQFSCELKKLYPDDFAGDDLSLEQVAGINDSIIDENKVEQIMKWIEEKDYSIILNYSSANILDLHFDTSTLKTA